MAEDSLKQRVRMMAIFWGVIMFVIFMVFGALRNHGVSVAWVLINLIVWSVGAALFGMMLYRLQGRRMRG